MFPSCSWRDYRVARRAWAQMHAARGVAVMRARGFPNLVKGHETQARKRRERAAAAQQAEYEQQRSEEIIAALQQLRR